MPPSKSGGVALRGNALSKAKRRPLVSSKGRAQDQFASAQAGSKFHHSFPQVLENVAARGSRKRALRLYLLETAASVALLCLLDGRAKADCAITPSGVTCTAPASDASLFTISPPPPPPVPNATVDVLANATVNQSVTIDAFTSIVFNNNGNITGNVTAGGITPNGDFTFDQNGLLSGNLTATSTGANNLIVRANRSINTVTMTGAQNTIDNLGVLNTTTTLNAPGVGGINTVTNRAGAAVNAIVLNAPTNIIDNSGLFNQGLQFNNSATATGNPNFDNTIDNRAGGVINTITSTGTASNNVDNAGTINGPVNLAGNYNVFVNRATIQGNVTFGGGNDVFAQTDGFTCCTVNMGDGNNQIFMFAGTISSNIVSGSGQDFLYWGGGNIVTGFSLGAGNDTALLSNLTSANLTPGLPIDGGLGNDQLVFSNSQNGADGASVSQLWNWETIRLQAHSQLTFSNYSTLTLGDSGTGTGLLSIESGSSVLAGNGTHTVRPYDPSALATVNNASIIDLTNSTPTATDQFVIYGNYVGLNGQLNLQTVLGTDNSPSDQLVIQKNSTATATPTASGSTAINVSNLNGPGALTTGDGIRVVDAVNGATTVPGAFTLGHVVAAGVFEYQLFRGGVTANTANDNDWFLRSGVTSPPPPPPPPVSPPPPVVPPTTLPIPAPPPPPPPPPPVVPPTTLPITVPPLPPPPPVVPPTTLPLPAPTPPPIDPPPPPPPPPSPPTSPLLPPPPPPSPPGSPPPPPVMPLIRPEIPGYVLMPVMAQQMGIESVGTFHKRRGDQSLLDNFGAYSGAWMRLLGETREQRWSSTIAGIDYQLAPKMDGHLWGIQTGLDLFGKDNAWGQERFGLFYTHTEATGTVYGNTLAINNNISGRLALQGDSIGSYWTNVGRNGWYLDAVTMYTWLNGGASSDRNIGAGANGGAVVASLEGGTPFSITRNLTLEPQAQIVWQRVDLGNTSDPFTTIDYQSFDAFTGRLGLRLEGNTVVNSRPVQSFISVDVWHDFARTANVVFNDRNVATGIGGTSLELRGGASTQITANVAAFGSLDYTTNLGGETRQSIGGNLGVRVKW